MTEQEIADILKVDRTTISKDVKALNRMSKSFIFDLARTDLGFYYKQCIDGIEEAHKNAWDIFHKLQRSGRPTADKDSLLALKLIIDCNNARFSLFKDGPGLMQIKAIKEKIDNIGSK